ncbi:MAG: DMT family transporter [Candidatus Margulisbacteria bacterium]|nr:DMT family transporter [Candidatus Margulisiibacteriota bacterium]
MKVTSRFLLTVGMCFAMLFWGITWSVSKLLTSMSPIHVLIFWRYFISSVFCIPILLWTKSSLRISVRDGFFILMGVFLQFLQQWLSLRGLSQGGFAGIGGVLVCTLSPMFTFILCALFFKKPFHFKEIVWIILGLIGMVILVHLWAVDPRLILSAGLVYFMGSAMAWSLFSLAVEPHRLHPFVFAFYLYTCTALLSACIYFKDITLHTPTLGHLDFWTLLLYLSILGTVFATGVFLYATSKLGAKPVSAFAFMVPVVSVISSYLFLQEPITIYTLVGGSLMLGAVYGLSK